MCQVKLWDSDIFAWNSKWHWYSLPPFSSSPVPMVAPGNVHVNVVNSTLAEVHWDPVPLKVSQDTQGYRASERHFSCSFRTCPYLWKAWSHFSGWRKPWEFICWPYLCSIPARVRSKSHCSQSERKYFLHLSHMNSTVCQLTVNECIKWEKLLFRKL